MQRVPDDAQSATFEVLTVDAASLEPWYATPELAFLLLAAGITCTAAGLAGHAVGWSLSGGVALLAGGGVVLAEIGASSVSVTLLVISGLCVALELFALTGYGLYAVGSTASLLLAGLALSGSPEAHPALVLPGSAVVGTCVFGAALTSWRRRRGMPFDATPRLAGRQTVVLAPSPSVPLGVVAGELWELEGSGTELTAGQCVRVVEVRNDRLVVRAARPLWPH
jgi:membrane-bound ClpP family serine protease